MKRGVLFVILISLTGYLKTSAQPKSANEILKEACQEAGKGNKKVIIIFHAAWCGWCHKMENSINDKMCEALFNKNYVIKFITVEESKDKINLENPGGNDMKARYNGKEQGLPFWLVFNADGKLLADCMMRKADQSTDKPGENTGCPASEKEVDYFITVLKSTSGLKEDELKIIATRFRKNEDK